jgi:hypothetical protein
MSVRVNVDNFGAAETARTYDQIVALAGGVNRWFHFRAPTPVDNQPVIRMNRDTLYSGAVVDASVGATLTIPDTEGRYVSVIAIDPEHYLAATFTTPGAHALPLPERGPGHLFLAARLFIDPQDPDDVTAVNELQDQFRIEAASSRDFEHPDYDTASLDETRDALLVLSRGISDLDGMFGSPSDVDPVRHLVGTAAAWGGLRETEAYYFIEAEPRPVGHYTLTLRDVPADGFWSVTVYNRDGYFEANRYDTYSVNSVTATAEADGSVVVNLSPEDEGLANHVYVMDGWNYVVRLYRPHSVVLDKTWTPPPPQPAD